jgi:hypothetical protein
LFGYPPTKGKTYPFKNPPPGGGKAKRNRKFGEISSRFCDHPIGLFFSLMPEVVDYSP